jgi:hypothetical protein
MLSRPHHSYNHRRPTQPAPTATTTFRTSKSADIHSSSWWANNSARSSAVIINKLEVELDQLRQELQAQKQNYSVLLAIPNVKSELTKNVVWKVFQYFIVYLYGDLTSDI